MAYPTIKRLSAHTMLCVSSRPKTKCAPGTARKKTRSPWVRRPGVLNPEDLEASAQEGTDRRFQSSMFLFCQVPPRLAPEIRTGRAKFTGLLLSDFSLIGHRRPVVVPKTRR